MNEFLQSDEVLTDEEILICAEEARLWEDDSHEDKEKEIKNNEKSKLSRRLW